MKKKIIPVLCIGLLLSGCGVAQTEEEIVVNQNTYPTVSVSPALEPVAQYLTQAVLDCSADEALGYILAAETTQQAYQALEEDSAQLLIAYETTMGEDVQWTTLGTDALVFAVSPDCAVEGLTEQQLRAIYQGSITDWEQVGGNSEPIVIRHRAKGSASRTALETEMPVQVSEAAVDAEGDCLYYMTYSEYQRAAKGSLKLLKINDMLPENDSYVFLMPYGAALKQEAETNSEERIVFRWLEQLDIEGIFPASAAQKKTESVHLDE